MSFAKKNGIGDFHHFNQFRTFDLGARTHTYIYIYYIERERETDQRPFLPVSYETDSLFCERFGWFGNWKPTLCRHWQAS